MAYIGQERKAQLAPGILAVCKRHGVKATLSVRHYSTLVITLKSGPINFESDYRRGDRGGFDGGPRSINHHWFREHYTGAALAFLAELLPAMNEGNHDRSDLMTDYHDVGWYLDIRLGKHDRPYLLSAGDAVAA
jgi:hypothetical protein